MYACGDPLHKLAVFHTLLKCSVVPEAAVLTSQTAHMPFADSARVPGRLPEAVAPSRAAGAGSQPAHPAHAGGRLRRGRAHRGRGFPHHHGQHHVRPARRRLKCVSHFSYRPQGSVFACICKCGSVRGDTAMPCLPIIKGKESLVDCLPLSASLAGDCAWRLSNASVQRPMATP